jgi:pimeloyl-ACP methyl ester carboxylesterase
VLVGHSLGASIALKYSLRWPEDVRALVLIGADARLSRIAPRMERTIALIDEVGLERWVAEHWSQNPPFSRASIERSPETLELYRQMVLANSPSEYVRACRAVAACEDLEDHLPDVDVPALVVVGGQDDRTLPADGRRLAEGLPRARLLEVELAGHSLPLEAPTELASGIDEFLDALDGGGAR